jgi:hypothetical protein
VDARDRCLGRGFDMTISALLDLVSILVTLDDLEFEDAMIGAGVTLTALVVALVAMLR